jgi:hypothetical protein
LIYALDCEFNGFGGELISLALAGERRELYLARPEEELDALSLHPWVEENVLPVLCVPQARPALLALSGFGPAIQAFLREDPAPALIADWPEDLMHFMQCLILAPGQMARIPDLSMRLLQVTSYPERQGESAAHNALWDARALRQAALAIGLA